MDDPIFTPGYFGRVYAALQPLAPMQPEERVSALRRGSAYLASALDDHFEQQRIAAFAPGDVQGTLRHHLAHLDEIIDLYSGGYVLRDFTPYSRCTSGFFGSVLKHRSP